MIPRSRYALLSAVILVLVAQLALANDSPYTDRAQRIHADVEAQIHLKHIDDSVKQKLESELQNLLDKAASIDQRQSGIDRDQLHINDLDLTYKNAKSKADGLASQLDQHTQNAMTKLQNLLNQLEATCHSLGGNWHPQSAVACTRTISCSSGEQDVCDEQKRQFDSAFNNAAGPYNSQNAAFKQSNKEERQWAQDARDASDSAKSDLDQANDALTAKRTQLETDKQAFEDLAKHIQSEAGSAPENLLKPNHSQTLDQLMTIDANKRSDAEQPNPCWDNRPGCNPVPPGTQLPGPPPVPGAAAPDFTKAHNAIQSQLDSATQKSDEARAAFQAAVNNHAGPEEFNQKLKAMSEAEQIRINVQFNKKMLDNGLLKPVPPKPSGN